MVSLIIDIVLIAVVWMFALNGAKKGLLKTLFKFGSYILSFVAAALFYKPVAKYIAELDFIKKITDSINSKITTVVAEKTESTLSEVPEFLSEVIAEKTNQAGHAIGAGIENIALNILSIILIYIAVKLVFNLLGNMSSNLKLPVLGGINSLAGTFFGVINALIIIYLVMMVVVLIAYGEKGSELNTVMQNTYIARYFYNNNIILKLLLK